ncbi:MAG: PD-(D/E)XK nuclease family protein [Gemmatimonadaceae bacterium]
MLLIFVSPERVTRHRRTMERLRRTAAVQAEHVSLSRVRRRAQCARKDWWQSEGSRDGFRPDAPASARHAYALKKLTSLPGVIGEAIHHAAATRARAIRDGMRPPSFDTLFTSVRDRLNAAVVSRNTERFLQRPAQTLMLREVFFGEWPDRRIPKDLIEETRAKVHVLLGAMLAHPVWDDLARCGRGEILVCDALDALEIVVDDAPVRVYAAPDLLWISHERVDVPGFGVPLLPPVVTILDWKTGRSAGHEEEARQQLAVYAWWASRKLDLPIAPAAFVGRVANLGAALAEDRDRQFVMRPDDVDRGRQFIERTAASVVAGRLPDGRVPMDSTAQSVEQCRWCSFTPLCFPETRTVCHESGGLAGPTQRVAVATSA